MVGAWVVGVCCGHVAATAATAHPGSAASSHDHAVLAADDPHATSHAQGAEHRSSGTADHGAPSAEHGTHQGVLAVAAGCLVGALALLLVALLAARRPGRGWTTARAAAYGLPLPRLPGHVPRLERLRLCVDRC